MSGWFCGLGLLSSSPKCSAHPLSWLSTPVRTVPLSLTGCSDFLNFPANFFVVSYNCFMFLLSAALSASSAGHLLCKSLDKVPFVCFDSFPHFSICCCVLFLGRYFCCPCAAAVDCPLLVFSDLYLPNCFHWNPVFLLWFLPAKYLFTCGAYCFLNVTPMPVDVYPPHIRHTTLGGPWIYYLVQLCILVLFFYPSDNPHCIFPFFFLGLRHFFLAWVLILQLQDGDQKQRLCTSLYPHVL